MHIGATGGVGGYELCLGIDIDMVLVAIVAFIIFLGPSGITIFLGSLVFVLFKALGCVALFDGVVLCCYVVWVHSQTMHQQYYPLWQ